MRAMLILVIAMGVLIVAGTATVAIIIVGRMAHPAAETTAGTILDQPPGTRIVAATAIGNRMALVLQGGGPDRVILVPPAPVRLRQ